ncbi:MAG: HAD family hydrolase [Myxococcota bacterium]
MFSPSLPAVFHSGPGLATSATHSVSSAPRVAGLPFSTPEQMIASMRAGLPRFDIDAMTRAGTALRAGSGPTSASAIGFFLPHAKVTPPQLIAALRRIDVGGVVRAGITPTAIFDFDNTIIGGDVFRDFVALLLTRAVLPQANAERVAKLLVDVSAGKVSACALEGQSTNDIVARALRMTETDSLSLAHVFFVVIGSLAGVNESKLTAVADELFNKGMPGKPRYRTRFFGRPGADVATMMRTLAQKGVHSHIITLGLPTVAREGAKILGIPPHRVHGFELEVVNGVCTGRAIDARLVGKHRVADLLVSPRPLFVSGDSVGSDTPMLARATVKAFAVDPDKEFLAHIEKNNSDVTVLTYKG